MAKTLIFNSYYDFLQREDLAVNGVSCAFAKANPNYEEDSETNVGCWECINCIRCGWCIDCKKCTESFDCIRCEECVGCSSLVDAKKLLNVSK